MIEILEEKIIDVSAEFGSQLRKYLNHFGLIDADIARLIRSNTDAIDEILAGKKGIVLRTAEKISWAVFGIRYFELGNPRFPLPKEKDLPPETQEAITERKKKGTPEINRNTDLNLPFHVRNVLKSGKLKSEFTSSDVWKLLPDNIKEQIKSIRITDLFKKGELKDKVEDTGEKRGREKLYKITTK